MITFSGGRALGNGYRDGMGKGFGGLARYLQHGHRDSPKPERAEWVQTRNLQTQDLDIAAVLMRVTARSNPRVERPVYHFGVSLAVGETLSREQWADVADSMLAALGLEEHQAAFVLHRDGKAEHLHIMVNRVHPTSLRVWKPQFDVARRQVAARGLERRLGLRIVPTARDPKRLLEALDERTPRIIRDARRRLLDDFQQATSWGDLETRLAQHGYRLEPARRGDGVVLEHNGDFVSLSQVDRTLSGHQFKRRFGGRSLRAHRADQGSADQGLAPSTLPIAEQVDLVLHRLASRRAVFRRRDIERAIGSAHPEAKPILAAVLASPRIQVVTDGDGGWLTTVEYLEAERRLLAAVDVLRSRRESSLAMEKVHALFEGRSDLSLEKRNAIIAATTQSDLVAIQGPAGSGKTTIAAAIARLYEQNGYQVRGAAIAGKAAAGLAEGAGIDARTFASLEHLLVKQSLGPADVLIIDEVGMVDVPTAGRVLDHAAKHGAKVIVLGDQGQLSPPGPGDAMRAITQRHPPVEISDIARQAVDWQREASQWAATGEPMARALNAYASHRNLHWHRSPSIARDGLLDAYFKQRYAAPDDSVVILASTRAAVADLNHRIRQARVEAGEIPDGIRIGGNRYAEDDRILFLRNDSGLHVRAEVDGAPGGVRNGDLGTILETSTARLRVRLDDGRTVVFSPQGYRDFAHGYAMTIHKAQGITVDRAYLLLERYLDRKAAYTAMTRHRSSLEIFADRATFSNVETLGRHLDRVQGKPLVLDHAPRLVDQPPTPGALEPSLERAAGHALSKLDRWDALDREIRALSKEAKGLPSINQLRTEIDKLERGSDFLERHLPEVFERADTAAVEIERRLNQGGLDAVVHQLQTDPSRIGAPNAQIADFEKAAGQLGAQAQDLDDRRRDLDDTLARVQRLTQRTLELQEDRASLGNRAGLEEEVTGLKALDATRKSLVADARVAESWDDLRDRLAAKGVELDGQVAHYGGHRVDVADLDADALERLGKPPQSARRNSSPIQIRTPDERVRIEIERVAQRQALFTRKDILERLPATSEILRAVERSPDLLAVGQDGNLTTRRYVRHEARLFSAAEELADRSDLELPPAHLDAVLAAKYSHLSQEQVTAVRHLTLQSDLAIVIGRAGAGKTTLAGAVVDAYQTAGYRVLGAAPSAKAARQLEIATGVPSTSVAAAQTAWSMGKDTLGPADVLILDEGGMVDTPSFATLVDHARERGAKLVVLGDPGQLQPVGPGDPLRALVDNHGAGRVEEVRRQLVPWQRAASEALAAGDLKGALSAYTANQRVRWGSPQDTAEGISSRYFEIQAESPGSTVAVLAATNKSVRHLNRSIRSQRVLRGEIAEGVEINGRLLARGDRLAFRNNDPGTLIREVTSSDSTPATAQGVRNGQIGTVAAVSSNQIVVDLDDGRRVGFHPEHYRAFQYGYALTVHRAQGATVDHAIVWPGRSMDRNTAYVALTRQRRDLDVFVDRDQFADEAELLRVLMRLPDRDLVLDHQDPRGLEAPATQHRSNFELERVLGDIETHDRLSDAIEDLVKRARRLPSPQTIQAKIAVLEQRLEARAGTTTPQALDRDRESLSALRGNLIEAKSLSEQLQALRDDLHHLGSRTELVDSALDRLDRFDPSSVEAVEDVFDFRMPGGVAAPDEHVRLAIERLAQHRAVFREEDLRVLLPSSDAVHQALRRSADLITLPSGDLSTRRNVRHEARLLEVAEDLADHSTAALRQDVVEAVLEKHSSLLDEQRRAVLHATAGGDLALIAGAAGTGKTTLARAIAEVYERAGYQVSAATPSNEGAVQLQTNAGVPSRTVAALKAQLRSGRTKLSDRHLLLIDHAGAVDTASLGEILSQARAASSKVVLLGDPDQPGPIGPGEPFRVLIGRVGAIRLDEIHRQVEPWQRAAARSLASGDTDQALQAYERRGHVHWHHGAETPNALARRYIELATEKPESSVAVLAARNDQVRDLNRRIRQERIARGEIKEGIEVGRHLLAPGDRISFQRNDAPGNFVRAIDGSGHADGIRTGAKGTVQDVGDDRVVVQVDDGRVLVFDPDTYQAFDYAYATSIYRAQPRTADQTLVLASHAIDRRSAYLALTRHRDNLELFVDRDDIADSPQLLATFSRERDRAMVADLVEPATLEDPANRLAEDYRLNGLLSDLERRDRLDRQLETLEARAERLPAPDELADKLRIREHAIGARFEDRLPDLYSDPNLVERTFEKAVEKGSRRKALRDIAAAPDSLGSPIADAQPAAAARAHLELEALRSRHDLATTTRDSIQALEEQLAPIQPREILAEEILDRMDRLEQIDLEGTPAPRQRAVHIPAAATPAEAVRIAVDRLGTHHAIFEEPALRALLPQTPEIEAALTQAPEILTLPSGQLTTRRYVRHETRLLEAAESLATARTTALEPNGVHDLLAKRSHLGEDQNRAAEHVLLGNDLSIVVGHAGTGKTTLAQTLREAYEQAGYRVSGAALSTDAAAELERSAGISSRSIAALKHRWNTGRESLCARDVLFVDEAGMIDTPSMAEILSRAHDQSAKVVFLGDPEQLQPVGPGDPLRVLIQRHGSATLEQVYRQREPWQRGASMDLARGKTLRALEAFDRHGTVHWHRPGEASEAVAKRYLDVATNQPGATVAVLAAKNDEVRQLNRLIRSARVARGELDTGIEVAGRLFAPGDRIAFRRNDLRGEMVQLVSPATPDQAVGVRNGQLGTLREVAHDRLIVDLDDGRQVAFNPLDYRSVQYGYASTVHRAQGRTVDHALVLASPAFTRNTAYVALTRQREGVHLFVDQDDFRGLPDLARAFGRRPRKDLVVDQIEPATLEDPARRLVHDFELESLLGDVERLDSLERAIGHLEDQLQRWPEPADLRNQISALEQRFGGHPQIALPQLYEDSPRASSKLAEAVGEGTLRAALREVMANPQLFGTPRSGTDPVEIAAEHLKLDKLRSKLDLVVGAEQQVETLQRDRLELGPRDALVERVLGKIRTFDQTLLEDQLARLPNTWQRSFTRDLVRSVRQVEIKVIAPIRRYAHRLNRLADAHETWHLDSRAIEMRLAGLAKAAPRAALRYLTPPQLRVVTEIGLRAARVASRGMRLRLDQ